MKEGTSLSITTIISLAVPICSVLGFYYATGYYQELGCQWVASLLTIQQIIMHSTIVSFFFIITLVLVAGMLYSGIKYWKILVAQLILFAIIAILLFILWLMADADSGLTGIIISISIISLYASYVAHTSVVISTGRTDQMKESLSLSMIGMIAIIAASSHTGQSYAKFQFKNRERFFPTISNGAYGTDQILLSAAGSSFLVANLKDGNIVNFKLIPNLQSYAINKSKIVNQHSQPN